MAVRWAQHDHAFLVWLKSASYHHVEMNHSIELSPFSRRHRSFITVLVRGTKVTCLNVRQRTLDGRQQSIILWSFQWSYKTMTALPSMEISHRVHSWNESSNRAIVIFKKPSQLYRSIGSWDITSLGIHVIVNPCNNLLCFDVYQTY